MLRKSSVKFLLLLVGTAAYCRIYYGSYHILRLVLELPNVAEHVMAASHFGVYFWSSMLLLLGVVTVCCQGMFMAHVCFHVLCLAGLLPR